MLNTQKTRGIPNVIGALETESLLTECLVITRKGVRMQQTAELGSAHILRKVLFILAYCY